MAYSEEAKSEYWSDADAVSALPWTARRMEASDDDDEDEGSAEQAKEKYRWSCVSLPRDESDDGEGSPEFYDELEGVGLTLGEEFELLSQEEEQEQVQEVQDTVLSVKEAKAKETAVIDEAFVPRSGSFYMHDDRFQSHRYRIRRGAMIGTKLWGSDDGSKWKHDKFEDMTDKGAPKCNGQHWKNLTKGPSYADTNQYGSLDNYGYQNYKTSRMVKGRGPVKYKPTVKNNNLNPSSKHQIPAKLKGRTTSSSSSRVSSRTSSPNIIMPPRSNERYDRRNTQLVSVGMGGEMAGYCFPSQKTYQPSSVQENQGNGIGIPLPPLCSPQLIRHPGSEYHQTSVEYLGANSSFETLPQTTSLGHDLVGRGSFQFGSRPLLSPVIQHGGLPYGAVDDHASSMALARHARLSQLGSRYGGKAASKLENEFRQRRL